MLLSLAVFRHRSSYGRFPLAPPLSSGRCITLPMLAVLPPTATGPRHPTGRETVSTRRLYWQRFMSGECVRSPSR